jgi:hypothetical protein
MPDLIESQPLRRGQGAIAVDDSAGGGGRYGLSRVAEWRGSRVMAGEGRPPTAFRALVREDVGERAEPGQMRVP